MKKRLFIFLVLTVLPFCAKAQFFTAGDDPAGARWMQRETATYRVIYPRQIDSLAVEYARTLEKYKLQVGTSCGADPGQYTRGKIPVILHAYNAYSNGSVAWAPKRMDLYTGNEMYGASAMTWTKMLAIHEQRHVAQMQLGLQKAQRPFGWFFGEMWNGLTAALYWNEFTLEGDAVATETALSNAGRGRQADFLNYYRIAFDNGDWRNWSRWRFRSQRLYAPDHYAAGYLFSAGVRTFWNCPDFIGQIQLHAAKRPYDVTSVGTITKKVTGKNVSKIFPELARKWYGIWKDEMDARAPYTPMEQVSETPSRYTVLSGNAMTENCLVAVQNGLLDAHKLVTVQKNGQVNMVRPFNSYASKLSGHGKNVYWSEDANDPRWSLKSNSVIRSYNTETMYVKRLTHKGRLFNPCPSPDGSKLATVENYIDGRCAVTFLSADKGKRLRTAPAPDSLQLIETVWVGESVCASAISENGYGIYRLEDDGTWTVILAPQPVIINGLDAIPDNVGHGIMFASDRGGSSELYHLDPDTGLLQQMTSTRYGAGDFQYSTDGRWLWCSAEKYDGKVICRTPVDSLIPRTVDFADIHRDRVADSLSRQEKELFAARDVRDADTTVSAARRYVKAAHLFTVHSWAPVYFNIDRLMSFTYDKFYNMLSLGAAAVSQNALGTAVANFGYSAHKDPDTKGKWRHSLHGTFTYSGWYPVLEASVDFNDRGAHFHQPMGFMSSSGGGSLYSSTTVLRGKPYVQGRFSIYIPWSWSRGGWHSGLVPKLSYTISNDIYDTGLRIWDVTPHRDGAPGVDKPVLYSANKWIPAQQLNASVRAYVMTSTAPSAVYPRLGIGVEAGYCGLPGLRMPLTSGGKPLNMFYDVMYAYTYMYLPGVVKQQGLRLTAKYQQRLDTGNEGIYSISTVNTLPRGLADNNALSRTLCAGSKRSLALTAEYAIPVYLGDLTFGDGFTYIRRMVLTPHFDFSMFPGGNLYSAGATLAFDFNAILWLAWPFTVGVTASCNGGSLFNSLPSSAKPSRWFVGPVFDISF